MPIDREAAFAALGAFIREELLRRPDFPLELDTALISGGYLDSLAVARLGVFIEEAFGVFIPDSALTVDEMDTPERILYQIERWQSAER